MVIATFDVQSIPNDGRSVPSFSSVLYELDEDVTRHRGSAPTRKHDNVQSTSYVQNATDSIRKQGGVPQQLYESNKMYGTQPNRIAFGSCNEQDMTNKLWNIISERKPTAFIWGGDAVYADTHGPFNWSTIPPQSSHTCGTPERLHKLYQQQLNNVEYRKLIEQNITIFGTYDDHDYGCNNGDSTFEYRYESSLEFVEFLGLPNDSPTRIRAQKGLGVYGVKLFDFGKVDGNYEVPDVDAAIDADLVTSADDTKSKVPSYSNRTVAVFVLDVRSNKSPWKQDLQRFLPDLDGDFLGEKQWEWFENSIRRSKASVNVVVSGLQFHGNRAPDGNLAEGWSKYPRSQQRLYDLLLEENVESPILISGDVHMTQLSRKDCIPRRQQPQTEENAGARRSLIELTTSGMTHSWGTTSIPLDDNNSFGPIKFVLAIAEFYRMRAAKLLMHSLHTFCPWTDVIIADDDTATSKLGHHTTRNVPNDAEKLSSKLFESGGGEGSKRGMQYSLEMNFGELEFDWDQRTVAIRSIGNDQGKPPLLMAKYSMDQLSGRKEFANKYIRPSDFNEAEQFHIASDVQADWVCVNYRGHDSLQDHAIGHVTSGAVFLTLAASPVILTGLLFVAAYRRIYSRRSSKEI